MQGLSRCIQIDFVQTCDCRMSHSMNMQTGFFHRNAVYQAYVDRPLSAFAASEPEVPQSVRLVLSAELCANLAACDPASAADTDLSSLLEQAFYEALSDRCMMLQLLMP